MESTNLTRKQQKIFAGNTTITDEQIAVFGSKTQTGTMTFSKDPDVIQNENWQKGWQNATVIDEAPFEEDFNAISFVNSYNTAYLLQKGIPEYSENTTYFKGSICMIIDNNGEPTLYYSKTDNNLNHNPTTDTTNWAQIASLYNNNFVLIDGSNAEFNNLSTNAKDNITNLIGFKKINEFEINDGDAEIIITGIGEKRTIIELENILANSSSGLDCLLGNETNYYNSNYFISIFTLDNNNANNWLTHSTNVLNNSVCTLSNQKYSEWNYNNLYPGIAHIEISKNYITNIFINGYAKLITPDQKFIETFNFENALIGSNLNIDRIKINLNKGTFKSGKVTIYQY